MRPATVTLCAAEGAEVFADRCDLRAAGACEALIFEADEVHILIANPASKNFSGD